MDGIIAMEMDSKKLADDGQEETGDKRAVVAIFLFSFRRVLAYGVAWSATSVSRGFSLRKLSPSLVMGHIGRSVIRAFSLRIMESHLGEEIDTIYVIHAAFFN